MLGELEGLGEAQFPFPLHSVGLEPDGAVLVFASHVFFHLGVDAVQLGCADVWGLYLSDELLVELDDGLDTSA